MHPTKRIQLMLAALALSAAALTLAVQARADTLDLSIASIADIQNAYDAGLSVEDLTEAYLVRIAAYDKQGPTINAVIMFNGKALADARALDTERERGERRGPLHGISVVLKEMQERRPQ